MRQTSWIPEEFAVVGRVLRLRQGESWQDGWVVRTVGTRRLAEQEMPDTHSGIKRHRRATGDGQRK
jgi:hypothetical protein